VSVTLSAGPNVFAVEGGQNVIRGVVGDDIVLVAQAALTNDEIGPNLHRVERYIDAGVAKYRFRRNGSPALELSAVATGTQVRVVTANVTITPPDINVPSLVYENLALQRTHRRNGASDSLDAQFAYEQPTLGRARSVPIVMWNTALSDGVALAEHFLALNTGIRKGLNDQLQNRPSSDRDRTYTFSLTGGSDGSEPEVGDYDGIGGDPTSKEKSGFKALEDIDEVSIVAAPGSTFNFASRGANALAIVNSLIGHATRMKYRIAVVDAGDKQSIADVRDMRGKMDSTYAAFYYPWIKIVDPVTLDEIAIPPSGSVAGIYARNDINRGVYKAPANEVVETAVSLELILNKAQQDILNPLGINCFRFFEGRGFRLWGARTASSDPEWKYVNLRRYFAYLEHSLDKGTQWAVFEPNGERLWANMRLTIADFLFNEWTNGALLGDRPEKAYFVKCDRSTMTQNDLDNGRLVCLVGVAPLRPAEYVIIRIGQFTADRKV
jgi:hypothetical protein